MTNRKTSKRAFLASIMALILCFAMLLGTTYAWFTDSVTSGRNIIVSGNLDIELDYWVDGDWVSVDGETEIFDREALWEPGYTEVIYLKLSNVGSLALKYQLGINILSESGSVNYFNEPFILSDYIVYDVIEDVVPSYATRDEARTDVIEETVISDDYFKASYILPEGNVDQESNEKYVALVVYMPEEVGNEANHLTGIPAPQIDLGINVAATQYTYEDDSFDDQYDLNAGFWAGETVSPEDFADNVNAAEKTVDVYTAAELAFWAANANAYRGYTVNILNNIDLSGAEWTPVNLWNPEKALPSINGNGHTISNMTISGGSKSAFIGNVSGTGVMTISDLTFENASVTTSGSYAGVVMGYQYGNVVLENVTVTDSKVESTAAAGIGIGGFVGFSVQNDGAKLTLTDCTATNNTIKGYHSLGCAVGVTKKTDAADSFAVNGTVITDNTVYYGSTGGVGGHEVGAGAGGYTAVNYSGDNNTIENNDIVGYVNISTADGLTAALDKGVSLINLSTGSDYVVPGDTASTIVGSGADTVIDIQGNISALNISNATVTGATSLNVKAGTSASFENVVFDSKIGGSSQGVVKGDVSFVNCTFEKMLHFDVTSGANIVVDGCTFGVLGTIKAGAGASSFVVKNTTFETTTSTSVWGEKGIIVYCPVTFENCEFNNRLVLAGSAGLELTFDGCTMNGGAPVYYTDNTDGIIGGGNVPTVTIK